MAFTISSIKWATLALASKFAWESSKAIISLAIFILVLKITAIADLKAAG